MKAHFSPFLTNLLPSVNGVELGQFFDDRSGRGILQSRFLPLLSQLPVTVDLLSRTVQLGSFGDDVLNGGADNEILIGRLFRVQGDKPS